MSTLTTNDLKKGTRIKLSNGWEADLTDKRKGNVREAKVFGTFTEIGSVYAHDIVQAYVDGHWVRLTHTESQAKCKTLNDSLFG